jgi:hypothetical protein
MKKQKYSEAELVRAFGLHKIQENNPMPILNDWLGATTILQANEAQMLDKMLENIIKNIDFWNEEELKMKFISMILNLFVDYDHDNYQVYYERTIKARVENIDLSVKTDLMIAKGIFDLPENPYLCFHEYKRKKNADDPSGQVLEAMLIAQKINNNNKPVYGLYIMGRFWYFMAMDSQRNYGISKPYVATEKDQLLQIIAILRKFKYIVETELLD